MKSESRASRPRILFFPDKISDDDSGARSARATLRTLRELDYSVAVFTADADRVTPADACAGVQYHTPRSRMGALSHFHDRRLLDQFREILASFQPDYFFMAGSVQKPAMLARAARHAGVKTVFLFYGTDYYCSKGFAGLPSGPCVRCIEHGRLEALRNDCIKERPKAVHFLKSALVRDRFREEILSSHKVVGYSDDQLNVYKTFGVAEHCRAKISLQFDPRELDGMATQDGDRFLVIGQPTMEKGWHTLARVFAGCATTPRIHMLFRNAGVEERVTRDFGLTDLIQSGRITTEREIVHRDDLLRIVAGARAIVIPSYYPTTGEFVLSESLIMGKPVIVYDAGAHKNIIAHRENGMMAAVGDFASFSRNIDEVNTSPELRASLSRGAQRSAQVLFDDETRLSSMRSLFE